MNCRSPIVLYEPFGGPGHPADGLFHQGAAEVVDSAGKHVAAQVVAELDPGALDRADRPVQEQPGHGRAQPGSPAGSPRAGPGLPGQLRTGVDERQQDKLGEAAGPLLDAPDHPQVADPVRGRVDVAVHHRGGRGDAGGNGGANPRVMSSPFRCAKFFPVANDLLRSAVEKFSCPEMFTSSLAMRGVGDARGAGGSEGAVAHARR